MCIYIYIVYWLIYLSLYTELAYRPLSLYREREREREGERDVTTCTKCGLVDAGELLRAEAAALVPLLALRLAGGLGLVEEVDVRRLLRLIIIAIIIIKYIYIYI